LEWTAEALVLGARPHGETSVILEVMTADFGRHLGLVKGGRSRRMQPVLQPGNSVHATWRARLDGHLGNFTVELARARAARLMETAVGLHCIQVITGHLRFLAERDPHPGLYNAAGIVLDHLADASDAGRLLVRFEMALLDELGFGIDLSRCAATGTTMDLAYVSPKSARAVSRAAGAPYADRLLPLPEFLLRPGEDDDPADTEIAQALAITGYFLDRHVSGPRGVPLSGSRSRLVDLLKNPG
jgi:DNA repair protein RecO (recombination protein O)